MKLLMIYMPVKEYCMYKDFKQYKIRKKMKYLMR